MDSIVKKYDSPNISVIVPIYNVEKYIRKCLDSLKTQTMKEIEIICIDDGSTDDSGQIADEYVLDPRFRIIHTENRGLSAARNRGIDESLGAWIMFVDSDDWVDPMFCEMSYQAMVENGADLVIFESVIERRLKKKTKINNEGIINHFKAYEIGGFPAWNKLYKKELFSSIRYPEGQIYEDIATTHKLINASKKIYYLKYPLYHYRLRKGSVSREFTVDNKRKCFEMTLKRRSDLTSYGYPTKLLEDSIRISALSFLMMKPKENDELYLLARNIVESTRGIPSSFNLKQKIVLILWKIDSRLLYFFGKVVSLILN